MPSVHKRPPHNITVLCCEMCSCPTKERERAREQAKEWHAVDYTDMIVTTVSIAAREDNGNPARNIEWKKQIKIRQKKKFEKSWKRLHDFECLTPITFNMCV